MHACTDEKRPLVACGRSAGQRIDLPWRRSVYGPHRILCSKILVLSCSRRISAGHPVWMGVPVLRVGHWPERNWIGSSGPRFRRQKFETCPDWGANFQKSRWLIVPSFRPGFSREDQSHLFTQDRTAILGGAPDDVPVDAEVGVNKNITKGDDLRLRHLGFGGPSAPRRLVRPPRR